jgi:hypothetical protein
LGISVFAVVGIALEELLARRFASFRYGGISIWREEG